MRFRPDVRGRRRLPLPRDRAWKIRDDHAGAGRIGQAVKGGDHGFVHRGEVVEVGDEDRHLDDVCKRHVGRFEKGRDVAEGLFGLRLDAFGKRSRGGIETELTGEEKEVSGTHALAVGADGGGGAVGGEDFVHS